MQRAFSLHSFSHIRLLTPPHPIKCQSGSAYPFRLYDIRPSSSLPWNGFLFCFVSKEMDQHAFPGSRQVVSVVSVSPHSLIRLPVTSRITYITSHRVPSRTLRRRLAVTFLTSLANLVYPGSPRLHLSCDSSLVSLPLPPNRHPCHGGCVCSVRPQPSSLLITPVGHPVGHPAAASLYWFHGRSNLCGFSSLFRMMHESLCCGFFCFFVVVACFTFSSPLLSPSASSQLAVAVSSGSRQAETKLADERLLH
ncbi:hypothetical protein LX36DRAFT_180235 [Colletotrichum falcatum]|nr:hypothetical protein LX36DRAFT_180235 [Colletotrichum falcatum]